MNDLWVHSCGHVRLMKAGVIPGGLCPECVKLKVQITALKVCEDAKLPPLYGTAKQIVWAEEIRAYVWTWTVHSIDTLQNRFFQEPYARLNIQMEIRAYKTWVRSIRGSAYKRRAAWWIENKDRSAEALYRDFWNQREKRERRDQRRTEREEAQHGETCDRPDGPAQ